MVACLHHEALYKGNDTLSPFLGATVVFVLVNKTCPGLLVSTEAAFPSEAEWLPAACLLGTTLGGADS